MSQSFHFSRAYHKYLNARGDELNAAKRWAGTPDPRADKPDDDIVNGPFKPVDPPISDIDE